MRDAAARPAGMLDTGVDLEIRAKRVRAWLFDAAFPFWADKGLDRAGPGFVERLTGAGQVDDVPYKRVRVQARQVYCFSKAALLGWPGDPLGVAGRGLDLLLGMAWRGQRGGWAATLTRSGAVLDGDADLYDTAFVLFALGWWYRATGDGRVLAVALETLDFLHGAMRHPSGRGYRHKRTAPLQSLQNPHMHLAEAMIVLRDATGHERFAAEADALVGLCLDNFVDRHSGTLPEIYSETWEPLPGPGGGLLEPGHHYEWVWLLAQHAHDGRGPTVETAMRRLFDFAVATGQARNGLTVAGVSSDGTVADHDHRLWPQVERIKAWIAMAASRPDARSAVVSGVDQVFDLYLDHALPGTWLEYRGPDLEPKGSAIPASSFYHLVLAFSEVLRFAAIEPVPNSPS